MKRRNTEPSINQLLDGKATSGTGGPASGGSNLSEDVTQQTSEQN